MENKTEGNSYNKFKNKTHSSETEKTSENGGDVSAKTCNEDESISKDGSSPDKVKSYAVVKYTSVRALANFAHLQCNTDLNQPPSNWLSSSGECYGLRSTHSTGFSSFPMAHMFPDCVGEVDVVSDAENIKKLLKIPYSKAPISMIVHRVGKTLLIDEFDIHKYLLRSSESDWEWIRKFFYEHARQTLNVKETNLSHKHNSRNQLQQRNLVSKFLYRSLAEPDLHSDPENPEKNETNDSENDNSEAASWPPLPEPTAEEKVPDSSSDHRFSRNVVWTFEDIRMLIGTDMPIFGDKTHPCVSLKLRDMSKPINILTGIDYWLDNLMCNVPELVMCYHLDGIVQKYELLKTEDLPYLENSKFSPTIIRHVAQNILSFLKSNVTKSGHTYWLLKGKDEEIVKLYDLTSLCSGVTDDKDQNPFTVPVAMLFYRVARNMKHSSDGSRQRSTILMLLKNCLALLTEEKYPQIVTSAHYMLSDLYIPANTNPISPDTSDDEEDNDFWSPPVESEENIMKSASVTVKALCFSKMYKTKSPKKGERKRRPSGVCIMDIEERCKASLSHISAGLKCLKYFDSAEKMKENCKSSQEEPKTPRMAHPHQPIPMPYETLSGAKVPPEEEADKTGNGPTGGCHTEASKKALLCRLTPEAVPTWLQSDKTDQMYWKLHLKTLIYEKAYLVYLVLVERTFTQLQYGSSLAYIYLVLSCNHALQSLNFIPGNNSQKSSLLCKAGDCCFMITKNKLKVDEYEQDYNKVLEINSEILVELQKDCVSEACIEPNIIPKELGEMEHIMLASRKCYKKALCLETSKVEQDALKVRLGNVENELGVHFMVKARDFTENMPQNIKSEEVALQLQELYRKSLLHLEDGLKQFEAVNDEANLALLLSNKGRLMRLCAYYHSPTTRDQMTKLEKHFYNMAIDSYERALLALKTRKANKEIWDTIMWEFSSALFAMGSTLQDFPSADGRTIEEITREVAEILMKGLKFCDLDTPGDRQSLYQYRAALLHHRLSSLYHSSLRRCMSSDETKQKNFIQIAKLHYEKAASLFLTLEHPHEYFAVQLEHISLIEHQAEMAKNIGVKMKFLLAALDLILKCRPGLQYVTDENMKEGRTSKLTSLIAEIAEQEEKTRLKMKGKNKSKAIGSDKKTRENDENEKDENVLKESYKSTTKNSDGELQLLYLLEQRLQCTLRNLTIFCKEKGGKNAQKESEIFKNMYATALRNKNMESDKELAEHLDHVFGLLEERLKDCNLMTKKFTR